MKIPALRRGLIVIFYGIIVAFHSVAQQFGITLKALYKLNNLPYGTPAEDGMTLFLQ